MTIERFAEVLVEADALIIGAGAGMGVDSGLPDFRGNEGFWRAYPPIAKLGISFADMANPRWFERDPTLAWGFYGHRLHLYRDTSPHRGFAILRHAAEQMEHGAFVFTSNVDGQFQAAGFDPDRIVECHGSLHHLQCTGPCSDRIWPAAGIDVPVDLAVLRASEPLPRCERCGSLARPNVLMFGDGRWVGDRTSDQERRLAEWYAALGAARLVVVELGAGSAVPTVRWTCQSLVGRRTGATLVRINPREPEGPPGTISLACGALAALEPVAEAAGFATA